jgi:DNA-directed RNA polymerase specialized sigma24 family protein
MPYADIAAALDISVKTVENQIGKALRHLRNAVESYRGI